jgi:hypothetical protein
MGVGGSWQPIETAPRDGTWLLLWCEFGDGDDEPLVARWTDYPYRGGEFGPFTWHERDGGKIAEQIPTHWKHIGKPRRSRHD